MEFSTEDLGQIVNDIWTSMLGFPVQARSAPAEMNGTRHLSASVQISGGWDGTVLVSCAEDLARKVAATMFDVDEILKAKPSSAKGRYIRSLVVSTTMGPGIRIDPTKPKGADGGGAPA